MEKTFKSNNKLLIIRIVKFRILHVFLDNFKQKALRMKAAKPKRMLRIVISHLP